MTTRQDGEYRDVEELRTQLIPGEDTLSSWEIIIMNSTDLG